MLNHFFCPQHPSAKSIYGWNMLGSICNASMNAVLLLIVTRTLGPYDGGVLSISITTAQLMGSIAFFEIRGYQVTDIYRRFSFSEYHAARLVSCFSAAFITLLWIFFKQYTGEKAICVLLFSVGFIFSCYEDIFFGEWQLHGRLDTIGKIQFIRILLNIFSFGLTLFFTRSLTLASLCIIIVNVCSIVFFDFSITQTFTSLVPHLNKNFFSLFREILPLFLSNFLLSYIISAPKLAIDQYWNNMMQTHFNILFMLPSIVNMFTYILYRMIITQTTHAWHNFEQYRFLKIACTPILAILILTIFILIIANPIGLPFLGFLYATDLTSYSSAFFYIILGSGLCALANWLTMLLILMRRQHLLLLVYFICWLGAQILVPFFTKQNGVNGASLSYLISMSFLVACCFFIALKQIATHFTK